MSTVGRQPNYLFIGACLAVLMILGVVLCEWKLGFPKWVIVTTVLSLSTIKAGLVALYYMHLKTDRRVLMLVALAPLFLIALAVGLILSSRLVRL